MFARSQSSNAGTAVSAALLLIAILLYCTGLARIDLWAPDEPRYGQIAEEMRSMEHGPTGLLLLHLNGEAYTQKPPLYYWLAAAGGWLTGGRVTETLARLPSALAGVGVVLTCISFGSALFGRGATGCWAAAILLSTWSFSHLARRAQLDVLLTLLEALALLIFWRMETGTLRRSFGAVALLHAAMGLAALTKGPVGWIPLLIITAYLAWERRLALLRRLAPPWALLLSVGPIACWVAVATGLGPEGYFQEAVVGNVFGRIYAAESHVRPFYYFLYQLPLAFLPGTLLAPLCFSEVRAALRSQPAVQAAPSTRTLGSTHAWRFLLCWTFVPLVIFSLASGKRGLYMLPVYPALALLSGHALDGWLTRNERWPRRASLGLFAIGAAVSFLAATFDPLMAAAIARGIGPPEGFEISRQLALALGGAMAGGLGIAAVVSFSPLDARAPAVVIVATLIALQLTVFNWVYPRFDAEKSPRPIARAAAELVAPGETIGIFDDQGLAGGIRYYGGVRAAILPRPPQVANFLETGGRLVILERWKLPWLDGVGRFEVLTSRREGRRELAIVRRVDAPSR